jgi:hypothetical protein
MPPEYDKTVFRPSKSVLAADTAKPQKPFKGEYPKEPEFQNSEYKLHQVGSKDCGSQNFRIIAFKEGTHNRGNFFRSNHVICS